MPLKDPIEYKKYQKNYRAKNKIKINLAAKKWHVANPDSRRQTVRKYKSTFNGRMKYIHRSALHRARKSGKEFTLTLEQIIDLWNKQEGKCALSGLDMTYDKTKISNRTPYTISLDRIDSGKGYTYNNCRLIVWALNALIGNFGYESVFPIILACSNRGVF
jgi:hypothetical protein